MRLANIRWKTNQLVFPEVASLHETDPASAHTVDTFLTPDMSAKMGVVPWATVPRSPQFACNRRCRLPEGHCASKLLGWGLRSIAAALHTPTTSA